MHSSWLAPATVGNSGSSARQIAGNVQGLSVMAMDKVWVPWCGQMLHNPGLHKSGWQVKVYFEQYIEGIRWLVVVLSSLACLRTLENKEMLTILCRS